MILAEQDQQSVLTDEQRQQIAKAVRYEIVRACTAYRSQRLIQEMAGSVLWRAALVLDSALGSKHATG
jgi:hypothetical protein